MKKEWENLAHVYAKKKWYGKGIFKHERIILEKISKYAESVIDVGCGTGRHVRVLKNKNIFVVGLDFSLNMIKEAKRMCNSLYVLGDARKMPFKSSSIDCCICLGNTIASIGERKNELLFGAQLAIDEMLRIAKKLVVVDFREGEKDYEKRFIDNMPYTTRSWKLSTALKLFKESKNSEKIKKIKIIKNVRLGGNNFFYIICFLK